MNFSASLRNIFIATSLKTHTRKIEIQLKTDFLILVEVAIFQVEEAIAELVDEMKMENSAKHGIMGKFMAFEIKV